MRSYVVVLFILALFQSTVSISFEATSDHMTSAVVQRELGERLSYGTTIFGPEDRRYRNATSRWSLVAVPKIAVVVEPAHEDDVSKIVKYCNEKKVEFLTYNRGHGWPTDLGTFEGVQISLFHLKEIIIQPDKQSAWFGGGTYAGLVSRTLWEKAFVTTTGACDCVGMMGSGLGGGHGRHESFYGMVSDNIRQLNAVLADGTPVRINSTNHEDLLWGMKGAGHNFGIVTSFEMNIYPRGPDTWHYHNYLWGGDKLEAVFNALNVLHNNGSGPSNLSIDFGSFLFNASVNDQEPIISWTFAFRGDGQDAEANLISFNNIESVYEDVGDVIYPDIAKAQGTSEIDPICQHNNKRVISTTGLQVYNVTTERNIFNDFVVRLQEKRELAQSGYILHEGYTSKGVNTVDPLSTAYPFRNDHLIMFFNAIVPHDSDLEDAAWEWADAVRDEWNRGQPNRLPNVYVNYASGPEPTEQKYGHERWRLEKLRALKRKYDPSNRFGFYNPIV